ncbi:MAG: putative signal transducing protein [Marinobacter sp.]
MLQIAYRARDITEAHIVAGLLEANGIEAHVGGHYLQGALGEIGAAGFTNVHVDDEDLYRARQLVSEYEETSGGGVSRAASDEEDRPDHYARWFLMVLAIIALILLQIY